ncbi:MAG: hypothetical protein ACOCSE_03010, partial [Chitinivibrionales bacterium]
MKNPKIEKCTITGLNITTWKEWQNLYCGEGYYAGFKLLGERIIISEVRGNCGNTGMLNLLKYRDGFAQYTGLSETKHIEIRDYSKQRGQPSHSGRNQFAAWILRQERNGNLLAYIGFNTNRGIRLAMAVGSKVHRIGFPLIALSDYRTAANQAVNILMNNNIPLYDNQNTPWITHESWKYKRDNTGWSFETSRGDILKINLYGDLRKKDLSSFEETYHSVIEYAYLQELIHSRILDCSKLTQKSYKILKPLLTEIFSSIEETSECMATCIITGKEKLITLPGSWTRFKSIHEAYEYILRERDLLLKKLPASAEITPPETREEIEKAISIV